MSFLPPSSSYLESLPLELTFEPLLLLPYNQLVQICQLNPTFNAICDDEYFWQRYILEYFRLGKVPDYFESNKQAAQYINQAIAIIITNGHKLPSILAIDSLFNVIPHDRISRYVNNLMINYGYLPYSHVLSDFNIPFDFIHRFENEMLLLPFSQLDTMTNAYISNRGSDSEQQMLSFKRILMNYLKRPTEYWTIINNDVTRVIINFDVDAAIYTAVHMSKQKIIEEDEDCDEDDFEYDAEREFIKTKNRHIEEARNFIHTFMKIHYIENAPIPTY